ncbi:MAG: xylulokinase [Alphaproteobacteria bacterium]
MTYLGIDIGTSSVKAMLIDDTQATIGSAAAPLDVARPHPGWSEQNPDDWWTATQAAVTELKRDHGSSLAAVRGIGLSGHMHGATLLDASDKPLRPCILWNDTRSAEQRVSLEAAEPRFRTLGGNIVMPGFTAPKLQWVRETEPKIFDKVAKVLLPKDYVRLKLVGDHVSDMSDSAGTLWMDVGARRWAAPLLAATGLGEEHMPRLVEGTESSGTLRAEIAAEWCMAKPPVVAGGGGDNAASACGTGIVSPGSAFASLGTSGVLFASNDRFSPNTDNAVHAFCHAVPDTWHQMGVILSATDSLNWLSGVLKTPPEELAALLDGQTLAPSPLLFLPYLGGERTPHNDAAIRGAIIGIAHETDATTLTQTVMEGVAFAFGDCLDALSQAGTRVDSAIALGGGSNSPAWVQILANVLAVPLHLPADGDFGAAFGAARLGLIAAENADPTAICTPPAIQSTVEPDPSTLAAYAEARARYKTLYPALKEIQTR